MYDREPVPYHTPRSLLPATALLHEQHTTDKDGLSNDTTNAGA